MQRISVSLLLALLLIAILGFTVYSQQSDSAPVGVQILQGNVTQQVPIDVTLLISTETGVQTVTVPLNLNVNLSVGPVEAVDMSVELEPASQFISPITVVSPAVTDTEMSETDMAETEAMSETETITE